MGTWGDWEREPDPPGVTWDEGNIAVRQAHDGKLQMFCVNASDRKPPPEPAEEQGVAPSTGIGAR